MGETPRFLSWFLKTKHLEIWVNLPPLDFQPAKLAGQTREHHAIMTWHWHQYIRRGFSESAALEFLRRFTNFMAIFWILYFWDTLKNKTSRNSYASSSAFIPAESAKSKIKFATTPDSVASWRCVSCCTWCYWVSWLPTGWKRKTTGFLSCRFWKMKANRPLRKRVSLHLKKNMRRWYVRVCFFCWLSSYVGGFTDSFWLLPGTF